MSSSAPLITLFGPTGVGKTALSLALAKRLGAHIVNADSRQLFQNMPLLTACPGAQDYAKAPHHLFEILPPTQTFSAGAYAALARPLVEKLLAQGHPVIVVGGTGFYIKALLEGLPDAPPIPAEVLQKAQTDVKKNIAKAFAEMEKKDPVWAQGADPSNPQRLARALAFVRHTGSPFSASAPKLEQSHTIAPQCTASATLSQQKWLKKTNVFSVLPADDAQWRQSLRTRWKMAVAKGLLTEVTALTAQNISPTAKSLESLTYPIWQNVALGKASVDEAITRAATADAQYAKRQRTWARTQLKGIILQSSQEDNLKSILTQIRA